MVKVDCVNANVTDLTHDGFGVVKVDDRVYFVDGVLPGEVIQFQPQKKRKGKLEGKLVAILESSSQRISPDCEYFGVCGGCALQHFDPHAQLKYKEKILFDNLTRIGKVTADNITPPIQGDIWNYRRKARLGIKLVPKKGGILVGFRERNSGFITSLKRCRTLDLRISELLPGLHVLLSGLSNNNRIPQVEVAAGDSSIGIVLRHLDPLKSDDISRLIKFAQEFDVQVYSQSGGPKTVVALWPVPSTPLQYRLSEFDLTLQFSPLDFIQVNAEGNQMIIREAIRYLKPVSSDKILDLFCGLGNFTLALAKSGAHVVGIEGDECLVNRGAANAKLNNFENVVFKKFDLHSDLYSQFLNGQNFNKILIDPPRSGALQIVSELVPKINPEVLVYVSCNPATLARDADVMVNTHRYSLTDAGAIDMFPHTAHVEAIAVFRRT